MNLQFFEPKEFVSTAEKNEQEWRKAKDKEFIINGKKIYLPANIYKHQEIDNKILILISSRAPNEDPNFDFTINRNIWCFDEKGEKLWEIMDGFDSDELKNPETAKKSVDPYTWVAVENGVLKAGTFGGYFGDLDIETGKVTNWKWSR